MGTKTEAQEEFDNIISKAEQSEKPTSHPSDASDYAHDRANSDVDEDTAHTQARIDESMRAPGGADTLLRLPPREFDAGRTTGVKGVIADARSFSEAARKFGRNLSVRGDDRRIGGKGNVRNGKAKIVLEKKNGGSEDEASSEVSVSDEDEFLERWRQQRRMELQQKGSDIRTRRTSPSVRRFGRFDEVDALGYLDAIEKVARDTIVVVFVYDSECEVSQLVANALYPLVPKYTAVHFVRVPYEDIEFDNAGVPAILAYKNQGDLFANLTYVVDQLPADTPVDTAALESVLQKHQVL